jgi:hypothetical protein
MKVKRKPMTEPGVSGQKKKQSGIRLYPKNGIRLCLPMKISKEI